MLSPSDRISVIQEIARRMEDFEWSVPDLTLREFGLATTDEWRGNRYDYVLAMLDQAPDGKLLDLGTHLGYDYGRTTPRVEPSFWKAGCFRLFISHLATHKLYASELQESLESAGISGFVAHRDSEPTREWQDDILLALTTCDALVALLHKDFHQSKWTDQEVGYAMGREILVVSVHLGETPYGFLSRHQAIPGAALTSVALAGELARVFVAHKLTSRAMAIALANQLAASNSFAEAKANMDLLEDVRYWDRRMADIVRGAPQSNGQVADAWGVPGRIESLLKKWEAEP